MRQLPKYTLSENQFAQLIGKCRMYPHRSLPQRKNLPELSFGDSQIGQVVKDYYKDNFFSRSEDGTVASGICTIYSPELISYIETFLCWRKCF